MTGWRIIEGDCRDVLASLPERSVHACVTSPPYFGLRDYGHDGQIGFEPTPDEFVAALVDVFRGVRRALRDDGTVWLNLGDSYNADGRNKTIAGTKPKDLLGIPWAVAQALRAPYYTGTIRDERDRIWLAAMIDAEGCMFIHKRKAGSHNGRKQDQYGAGLEVSSTDRVIVERVMQIVGRGSICEQGPDQDARRRQTIYRWNLRSNECREVVREVYPHLVAKQHEARLLIGCPPSGAQAEAAWEALKAIHQGGSRNVDFPVPPSMFEPGWYLRSDVIWSKSNPMPESVTDRPTKSHEYVFLLSKGASYFYDADAIREPHEMKPQRRSVSPIGQRGDDYSGQRGHAGMRDMVSNEPTTFGHPAGRNKRSVWTVATQPYAGAHFATFPPKLIEPCILAGAPERACGECGAPWARVVENHGPDKPNDHPRHTAPGQTIHRGLAVAKMGSTWTRETLGFEPSCSHDDGTAPGVVLDPFAGSGTTGMVALRHGRSFVGVELSPAYAAMARWRIRDDAPLLNGASELAA